MLFVNVFILLSLLESAYSGVISHKTDIDKNSDMDTFVEQDIDDILQQMEEDGESMLELMQQEDSEAMLEDAERVERSVGELFERILEVVPVIFHVVKLGEAPVFYPFPVPFPSQKPFHPDLGEEIVNATNNYYQAEREYYVRDFLGNDTTYQL